MQSHATYARRKHPTDGLKMYYLYYKIMKAARYKETYWIGMLANSLYIHDEKVKEDEECTGPIFRIKSWCSKIKQEKVETEKPMANQEKTYY